MKHFDAQVHVDCGCLLGEGPVYMPQTNTLTWIDILRGIVYIQDEHGVAEVSVGQYVGAVVPAEDGTYLAALTTGFYQMDRGGLRKRIGAPAGFSVRKRFNDAKCDAAGRLWAGSLSLYGDESCELYCVEKGNVSVVLDQLQLPNGMDWNGNTFYFIDTPTKQVDAYAFDLQHAAVSHPKPVAKIELGVPDGMTLDANGNLWVAQWDGGCVGCYDPQSGEQIACVHVPASNVTSCCFGGQQMNKLFITTAYTPGEKLSGHVFCADVGATGHPPFVYRW